MWTIYREYWPRSQQVLCDGMIVGKTGNDTALGHWIGGYYQQNGRWYYQKPHCSVCGHEHDGATPYCEQCGSKMKLKEEYRGG